MLSGSLTGGLSATAAGRRPMMALWQSGCPMAYAAARMVALSPPPVRALDRPDATAPLLPAQLIPHPDRLDPHGRPDYVAIMDAHHRALLAGEPAYTDPISGLYV